MTVQEAKERLIEKLCHEKEPHKFCRDACMYGDEHCEVQVAIKCMEEVEQYRALGTVEELKDLKEMNKNCTIEQLTGFECSYNETGCSDCKGKQALLEAMEKKIPKKVIRQKGECYAKTTDGKEYHEIILVCPNCHRAIKRTEALDVHCKYCGQALKWGEE